MHRTLRPSARAALARQYSRISHDHSRFLNLVGAHGDGEVLLREIAPLPDSRYTGKVVEILLNNPAKRNAICGKMMNQLAEIVDHLVYTNDHTNDDHVAVVLRGAGNEAFSAGADFGCVTTVLNTPERGFLMSQFMTDSLNKLRDSGLISLVCINGFAIGGGAELTTVGDFRLMEHSHYIQFVHARLGAAPGWGGARRLTEIVGRRNALPLLLGSLKTTPEKALEIGLVDGIVRGDGPMTDKDWHAQSLQFLAPYLVQPYPKSIRAIKRAVAGVEALMPSDAVEMEQEMLKSRWCSEDNLAAFARQAEKVHKHHQDQLAKDTQ